MSDLSRESSELLKGLKKLQDEMDAATLQRYSRVNPFAEDIVDWEEKGERYLNDHVVAYGSATLIGDIIMGQHCWIGPNCLIDGSGGLTIGDYCVFAAGTHVYTHDTVKWTLSGGKLPYHHAAVSIGNRVFIGAQSVILAGVTIADCCLISANATVTSDVPPNSIVAGTPARVIGKVVEDGDDIRFEYPGEDERSR